MRLCGERIASSRRSGGGAWAARGCLARRRLPPAKPLALEPTARCQAQHAEASAAAAEHVAVAADQLSGILHADDVLIFTSAMTPDKGRDSATLMKNVRMAENVCSSLRKAGCAQVIYISSDAVYDNRSPLVSEAS